MARGRASLLWVAHQARQHHVLRHRRGCRLVVWGFDTRSFPLFIHSAWVILLSINGIGTVAHPRIIHHSRLPSGPTGKSSRSIPRRAMAVSQETVERIQRFSEKRQKAEETYNDQPLSISNVQTYNSKLDDTLRQLQDRVRRHEKDLRKVSAPRHPIKGTWRLTCALASGGQFS